MQFQNQCSRFAFIAALVAFALLLMQPPLFAQQTGQITGTVVDTTGAAIVNAKVILTDEATQDTRQTVTNHVGFFSFSAVMPANYDLKVESHGFKTVAIPGVHMSPGDKRDVTQISMSPGAAAEEITVQANVTGVDIVSSPEKASLITAEDIKRQSTMGRNALELIRLLPGMSVQGWADNRPAYNPGEQHLWNSPTGSYAMSGTAPGGGGQTVSSDGAQILDVGNMGATLATVNMDMVEEVKVQTSNFSADTNHGPVVINAVSKSGTNAYHGAAYFYARNKALNAQDWLDKNQGIKPLDNSYYYPGGNIGGPVKVPGTSLEKKMFFFVGGEAYRQHLPQDPIFSTVPTDGMRKGDFSWASMAPLCAPQMPKNDDGTPWQPYQQNPNIANVNKGPSQCYTPTLWWNMQNPWGGTTPIVDGQLQSFMMNTGTAAFLQKWLPAANATPSAANNYSNFAQGYSNEENSWQLHPRVDYNFNDANKLSFTYNLQKEVSPTARAQWWAPQNAMLYPGKVQAQITSHVASANFLRVFSPSLTSETVVAASIYRGPIVLTNPEAVSRKAMDFPSVFDNGVDQLPRIWGNGTPSLAMQSGFINNRWLSNKSTYTLQENVTKVFSTHTLKVGGSFERIGNSANGSGNTAGSISFPGNDWQLTWSGQAIGASGSGWARDSCQPQNPTPACFNPIANTLFGWAGDYSQDEKALLIGVKTTTLGVYATDNWKATRRLTFDVGVRYDHMTPWTDMHGFGAAIFDPKLYAQQVTIDSNDVTHSSVQYPGMRWHAMDKSVPMAGTDTEWGFVAPRLGLSWDVFGTGKWVLRGGWGSYYYQGSLGAAMAAITPGMGQHSFNMSQPYGGWDFATISAYKGSSQVFGDSGATFITPNQKQPRTDNWNFTISHPTIWNSFLEISYVGNNGLHQMTPGKDESINLIPIGTMYTKPYYKAAIDNNNRTAKLDALAWNTAGKDWYRPYSWYNDGLNTNLANGYSNYHALQISWNKTKGWATWGLNYTFSKVMGIYTDADPFNLQNDYGPLSFDRTHLINASYSFDLGNHVHGDFPGSKIVKGVVNGWMLSGITQWMSGPPYQAITSSNLGFNTWVTIHNTYNYDAAGDPLVPNQASQTVQMNNVNLLGTPDVALFPTIAPNCNPTANNGDKTSVFNTACFIAPEFLKNGRTWMGYFHSTPYTTSDLTMAKTFRVAEKKSVQFRMSAFNFLNHPLRAWNTNDYSGNLSGLSVMNYPNNDLNSFEPGQRLHPSDWLYNTNGSPIAVGTPPVKRGYRTVMMGAKFEF